MFWLLGSEMSEIKRPVTLVACGILMKEDGGFLMGSRPEGKPYAGYWEFPGGKLEFGESVHQALAREMREELGLMVKDSAPWVTLEHDYPHAYVRLHFVRSWDWMGIPRCLEGQSAGFFDKDHLPDLVLPTDEPIRRFMHLPLHWLRLNATRQDWETRLRAAASRQAQALMVEGDCVADFPAIKSLAMELGIQEVWVHVSANDADQACAHGVFVHSAKELSLVKNERLAVPALPDYWGEFEKAGALWAYSTGVQVGSSAWQKLFLANPMPIYLSGVVLDDEKPLRRHGAQGWIENI